MIIIMDNLYQNKQWLENHYINLHKSSIEISKICNCSKKTILKWLKRFNIPRRNLSESHIGQIPWNKNIEFWQIKGDKHPNWKGDKAGYHAIHKWIQKNKEKPKKCEECNRETNYLELSNISGDYKRDINDYRYLCKVCHKKYDGVWKQFIENGKKTRFKKGHTINKDRIFSEEHKKKLSEAKKGRTFSQETRKKMSEAQKERWKKVKYKA